MISVLKKITKHLQEAQKDSANLQQLQNPGNFSLSFFPVDCLDLVFSSVLILCSTTEQQAWHLDTPIQGVYTNIFYLDDGKKMTQFIDVSKICFYRFIFLIFHFRFQFQIWNLQRIHSFLGVCLKRMQ